MLDQNLPILPGDHLAHQIIAQAICVQGIGHNRQIHGEMRAHRILGPRQQGPLPGVE